MYQVVATNQFGKDYKKCLKRNFPIQLLDSVILSIAENKVLPAKNKKHKLEGKFKNCWECHIQPDWLLIWQQEEVRP